METVPCPLCGFESFTHVLTSGDMLHDCPGEFKIVRCDECGHVYQNPRPTPDAIAECYPQDYEPYRAVNESDLGRVRRQLRKAATWLLDSQSVFLPQSDRHPPRGLDIGCATGRFLVELQKRGWEAVGIEPSPAAAEAARSQGFEVTTGTLDDVRFEAGRFDAVFLWMVLEHVHDPVATLVEIRRILVPRGSVVFSVPRYDVCEAKLFGRYWLGLELPRHLHQYTKPALVKLLQETGFVLERIIPHRSALSALASIGLYLRSRRRLRWLGERILRFTANPRAWGLALLWPFAFLQAAVRQSPWITVVASVDPRTLHQGGTSTTGETQ